MGGLMRIVNWIGLSFEGFACRADAVPPRRNLLP